MELNVYQTPPVILEKINILCNLLQQDKIKYERVSATIPDKELRRTILSLAQESNQYACELSSQIQTLGGNSQKEKMDGYDPDMAGDNLYDEKDILNFCEMNEKKMVSAYREILNESYLYEGLRKLIRYQLNGILCSFTQLRLLNSLRFR
jgi:hypothetical protein